MYKVIYFIYDHNSYWFAGLCHLVYRRKKRFNDSRSLRNRKYHLSAVCSRAPLSESITIYTRRVLYSIGHFNFRESVRSKETRDVDVCVCSFECVCVYAYVYVRERKHGLFAVFFWRFILPSGFKSRHAEMIRVSRYK